MCAFRKQTPIRFYSPLIPRWLSVKVQYVSARLRVDIQVDDETPAASRWLIRIKVLSARKRFRRDVAPQTLSQYIHVRGRAVGGRGKRFSFATISSITICFADVDVEKRGVARPIKTEITGQKRRRDHVYNILFGFFFLPLPEHYAQRTMYSIVL